MVITGSRYFRAVGELIAPSGFPNEQYPRDATSYIFVLENVATEGSVQLTIETFDLHPKSWLTVSKT